MKIHSYAIVLIVGPVLAGCNRDAPPADGPVTSGSQADVPTNRIDVPPTVRRNLGITFAKVEARYVAQTIRDASATGLAGCSIEDHTNRRDDPIFDFTLTVERIRAAAEARRELPHDFLLTARCDNFL